MIDGRAARLRFAEIDSTNAEAVRRAEAGDTAPVWIIAERQSAGRGRRGRAWLSEPGNLFLTYLGRTQASPAQAALLGFAAGVALFDACALFAPAKRLSLKWPNDLMLDGRKCSGILLESGAAPGGGLWFALGVGLNLASAPALADREAASLREASAGEPLSPDALADAFIPGLARLAADLETEGFAGLREAWLSRAHPRGTPLSAEVAGVRRQGRFAGLAGDGALLFEPEAGGGPLVVSAGDVFLTQEFRDHA